MNKGCTSTLRHVAQLLLRLKYGMEICFESQYPSLFGTGPRKLELRNLMLGVV